METKQLTTLFQLMRETRPLVQKARSRSQYATARGADAADAADAWHIARARHVGASEVPALFGCGWETPAEVLLRKRTSLENGATGPTIETERMRLGNAIEEIVVDEYRNHHVTGESVQVLHNETTLVSEPFPFLIATPDAFAVGGSTEVKSMQIKCTSDGFKWRDGVPEPVMLQMQTEMAVCGPVVQAAIALRFYNLTVRSVAVRRDERIIGEIVSVAEKFYRIMLDGGALLDRDWIFGTQGERRALGLLIAENRGKEQKTISLPAPEHVAAVAEIERMKAVIKRAEARKRLLENQLMADVGDASVAELADGTKVKLTVVKMPERHMSASTSVRLTTSKPKGD
jgi:predicted phage-related endonuclease